MRITRKTNILVKTERRFVVREAAAGATFLCGECGAPMLPAQAAANLFVVSSRTVYRLVELAAAHFKETETNELYVCPASVREALSCLGDQPPPETLPQASDE